MSQPYSLVPDEKNFKELLASFQEADNSQILCIIDYDKTLTRPDFSSWDFPALYDDDWPTHAHRLRARYKAKEITEGEFWERSIEGLRKFGFYEKVESIDFSKYLDRGRRDLDLIIEKLGNLGRSIIYSAGVGEVIEGHLGSMGEPDISVLANFNDQPYISSSMKTGGRLQSHFDDLGDHSHLILIGDSPDDTNVVEDYSWPSDKPEIMSIAIAESNTYEEDRAGYMQNFDLIIIDHEGFGELPDLLGGIVGVR